MPAFIKAKKAIADGTRTIKDIRKVYKVSKKVAELLVAGIPTKPIDNHVPDPGPDNNQGLPF